MREEACCVDAKGFGRLSVLEFTLTAKSTARENVKTGSAEIGRGVTYSEIRGFTAELERQ